MPGIDPKPDAPGEGTQADAARQGRQAPAVTPPVLLSDPRDSQSSPGQVTLERGLLIPGMHMTLSEGRVVLAVLVRADGTVGSVRVRVSSEHPALDAAAVEAAGRWRFRPALREGVPIDAWAIVPVRFGVPRP